MKRVIFWITFVPSAIVMFVLGMIALLPCAYIGAVHVLFELLTRYERFMLGHQGYNQPLKDVFLEGFQQ